jgi:hypothetical protein
MVNNMTEVSIEPFHAIVLAESIDDVISGLRRTQQPNVFPLLGKTTGVAGPIYHYYLSPR